MRLFCRVGCAFVFVASLALPPISIIASPAFGQPAPKQIAIGSSCLEFGPGFLRDPGTGFCFTYGGSVAASIGINALPSGTPRIGGVNNTSDQTLWAGGINGDLFVDVRSGGFRFYTDVGAATIFGQNVSANQSQPSTVPGDTTDIAAGFYYSRAFLQFAGFTVGKAQSFFDINTTGGYSYYGLLSSSSAAPGTLLAAYTQQFGNGFSATLSLEDAASRRNALWDADTFTNNTLIPGLGPGPNGGGRWFNGTCGTSWSTFATPDVPCGVGSYADQQIPDIVSSLRVDQAWGSAQIAGAMHQLRATVLPGAVTPSDKWGWAAMGGIVFNLPWNPGDKFFVEGAVGQGAPSYTGFAKDGVNAFFNRFNGNSLAAGYALDGVFASNPGFPVSGIQLPTSWDVTAALEHYWTPALRTSFYGTYAVWNPGSSGNAVMCRSPDASVRTVGGLSANGVTALAGCDFSFAVWGAGARTIWNPVKNLDVGVEVIYSQIDQHMDPILIRTAWWGGAGRPAGNYVPSNEGVWSGMFRVQRNFWP